MKSKEKSILNMFLDDKENKHHSVVKDIEENRDINLKDNDHGLSVGRLVTKGGQGSGNFGHSGRPGQVGGSGGGIGSAKSSNRISNDGIQLSELTSKKVKEHLKSSISEVFDKQEKRNLEIEHGTNMRGTQHISFLSNKDGKISDFASKCIKVNKSLIKKYGKKRISFQEKKENDTYKITVDLFNFV